MPRGFFSEELGARWKKRPYSVQIACWLIVFCNSGRRFKNCCPSRPQTGLAIRMNGFAFTHSRPLL